MDVNTSVSEETQVINLWSRKFQVSVPGTLSRLLMAYSAKEIQNSLN
jgi:hypothetical protein